jgi:sarcosine oxidase subunit gamma
MAGPCAAEWLAVQGISVSAETYEWRGLQGDAGLVVRLPSDEFFVEDGLDGCAVLVLKANLGGGQAGCYPIERQDAGLLVSGAAVLELIEHCCGVDFGKEPEHAVMTRVAGVSCMVLCNKAVPALRVWCTSGVAVYLWETLSEIAHDLGGGPVGLDDARFLL